MKTKTSLYDFFAMVIPGFLWLLLISFWCNWHFTFAGYSTDSIIGGTLLFIACYTIGLVYHKLVERITNKCFRNNECSIKDKWKKFKADYEEDGGTSELNTNGSRHDYFTGYYALMKENMLYNIPVLEAQVAFLRNMVLITLVYIITYIYSMCCCGCSFCCHLPINPCCLVVALLILLFFMVKAFISIQNKIYYLVWEGYEYLFEVKANSSSHPTP
jgi:hypothetical protein